MRHLLDILYLSVEEIDELLATANDIIEHPEKYRSLVVRVSGFSDYFKNLNV